MSPACWAPASAMAPATMLATTRPGEMIANTTWLSLPMAEVGFRSVWPCTAQMTVPQLPAASSCYHPHSAAMQANSGPRGDSDGRQDDCYSSSSRPSSRHAAIYVCAHAHSVAAVQKAAIRGGCHPERAPGRGRRGQRPAARRRRRRTARRGAGRTWAPAPPRTAPWTPPGPTATSWTVSDGT